MAVEKDESINKREVVVTLFAYEVKDMLASAALNQAGMAMGPGVTIEVECKMTSKDSLGYERPTEGLGEGARIKITLDRDYKPTVPDKVEVPEYDQTLPVEAKADQTKRDKRIPERKLDVSGRIKD